MTKKLQPFFWLALLAHLLLFLSFSISLLFEPEQPVFEKKSDKYLPAYLYQKQSNEQPEEKPLPQRAPETPPEEAEQKQVSAKSLALKKQEISPKTIKPSEVAQPNSQQQPKAKSSSAFIQAESPTTGKPIDEPLLKELSRATAAKLFYPPDAAAFRLTGTATISFMLYPDGRVTDVTLVKSSGFRILDDAALSTIKAISPVRDANLYLNSPKTLLAGIIFG